MEVTPAYSAFEQVMARHDLSQANSLSMERREQIKDEFMALFYKEILKQAFKAPKFSVAGQEEQDSLNISMASDLMASNLAMELARQHNVLEGNAGIK